MSEAAMYKALIEAKVSEDVAERAVRGLAYSQDVASKSDLSAAIAQLEARLMRWQMVNTGVVIGVLGMFEYFSK